VSAESSTPSSGIDPRAAAPALRVAAWVLAGVGVFWLPWYFGSTTPVNGESYTLGFNNRLALLCLAAAFAFGFSARFLDGHAVSALGWLERRVHLPRLEGLLGEYSVFAAWTVVWSSALWWWGTFLADPGWGDARIFHHGMSLIALGQVPYRDFMWNYGPAMLYLPYWLSWLTGGDLSFERAYLVVVLLFNALGYAGVFLILRALAVPGSVRPIVLALALLSWAELNLALQYSTLRFVVVPAGLILMHEAVQWGRTTGRSPFIAPLAAAAAMIASLSLSPEMAIAMGVAIGAYAFVLGWRREFTAAAAVATGVFIPVAMTLLAFPDYLLSVLAFAAGQMNFPIYPNLNNVTLVAASLVVIPALIASALMDPSDSRAPLAMAQAVGAGMLLPAAFGRADPIHVSFNGVVPVLVMFAVAAAAGAAWLRRWMVVYAVVLIGAVQVSYWSVFTSYFRDAVTMRRLYDANPGVVAEWKADWDRLKSRHPLGNRLYWGNVLPFPNELDQLTEKGTVIQIGSNGLGDEWNCWLGRYLLLQPDAPLDYFHPWTQGAVTPAQMARRVEVCHKARYLLIPEAAIAPLAGPTDMKAYASHIDRFFSSMLVFPVRCSPKHEPFQPETEMTKMLLEDYKPIGRFQFFMYAPFIVCEKKTPE
jgi:hypothetical protein